MGTEASTSMDALVEAVEEDVGMGCGAWDMVPAEKIVESVLTHAKRAGWVVPAALLDDVRTVLQATRDMHRIAADALHDENGDPHRNMVAEIDVLLRRLSEGKEVER